MHCSSFSSQGDLRAWKILLLSAFSQQELQSSSWGLAARVERDEHGPHAWLVVPSKLAAAEGLRACAAQGPTHFCLAACPSITPFPYVPSVRTHTPMSLFNSLCASSLEKKVCRLAQVCPKENRCAVCSLCPSTQTSPSQLLSLTHLQQTSLPEDLWQPAIWGKHSPRMLILSFSTG